VVEIEHTKERGKRERIKITKGVSRGEGLKLKKGNGQALFGDWRGRERISMQTKGGALGGTLTAARGRQAAELAGVIAVS